MLYLMPRDWIHFPSVNRSEKVVKELSPGMPQCLKSVKWGGQQIRRRINQGDRNKPESMLCLKPTETVSQGGGGSQLGRTFPLEVL